MQAKFEEQIELIIRKSTDMGIIDYAILYAEERGEKNKSNSVVKNLLSKGKLTMQEIAEAAEVPLDLVKSIKKQLSA